MCPACCHGTPFLKFTRTSLTVLLIPNTWILQRRLPKYAALGDLQPVDARESNWPSACHLTVVRPGGSRQRDWARNAPMRPFAARRWLRSIDSNVLPRESPFARPSIIPSARSVRSISPVCSSGAFSSQSLQRIARIPSHARDFVSADLVSHCIWVSTVYVPPLSD